jgi:hypothetical protein
MVEVSFMEKVVKRLERYLIQKNGFRLQGLKYDLILFSTIDRYFLPDRYSLMLSSAVLDHSSLWDVAFELFSDMKKVLSGEEYLAVSNINVIHSDDPFVKKISRLYGSREPLVEIRDEIIAGTEIEFAYLVNSSLLGKLVEGKALAAEILCGDSVSTINMGIIRIESNFDVVYYTGKGLREIFRPELTGDEKEHADFLKTQPEAFLIEHQYVSKIAFDSILKIE